MAKEQDFSISVEPTIYFYVNKKTEQVEFVSMYFLFGNTIREKGQDWEAGSRDDLEKYYSPNYEIWSYDWNNEDSTPGSGADMDPDNEEEWEIELVQRWGRGEDLSRSDVEETCRLVNSGDYLSAEEAAEIPGE